MTLQPKVKCHPEPALGGRRNSYFNTACWRNIIKAGKGFTPPFPKNCLSIIQGRAGFTLIELGLVIVILSILLLISAPNFRRFFQQIEFDATVYKLLKVFSYAREESISKCINSEISFQRNTGEYVLNSDNSSIILQEKLPQTITIYELLPQEVKFFPDGTATPFFLGLESQDGKRLRLKVLPFTARAVIDEVQ
ncbi:MAG: prepilin-type N-terminal cleavage/methylation domain-containing protein [Elusimicrobiota bacterium]